MQSQRVNSVVSKVLKRLYPQETPCTSNFHLQAEDKKMPGGTVEETEVVNLKTECTTGDKKDILTNQKLYSVSLPPEDYVPGPKDGCQSSSSEESTSSENAEGCRLSHRRRRKKKKGVNLPSCTENQNNIPPQKLKSQPSDCGTINKNKRRKLKRKRQKERMRAAGLLPKASAVDFIYQPDEVDPKKDTMTCPGEMTSEADYKKMSDDLLEFFQATQEIYFTDSKSKCADPAASIDIVFDILKRIENAEIPSSDVSVLHHLKTLLLLQDIERLKDALDDFKEHSSLPLDQKATLCSLFHYWVTDILPMRCKE